MIDWQPIQTAPKYRQILFFIQGVCIEGSWNGIEAHIVVLSSHGCGCCGGDNELPTHWAELNQPVADPLYTQYRKLEGRVNDFWAIPSACETLRELEIRPSDLFLLDKMEEAAEWAKKWVDVEVELEERYSAKN